MHRTHKVLLRTFLSVFKRSKLLVKPFESQARISGSERKDDDAMPHRAAPRRADRVVLVDLLCGPRT